MSLNKFTDSTKGYELDLGVGADEMKANQIETTNIDLVTINGEPYTPVTSVQTGASVISVTGISVGSITYQNFTRVGNTIEATIRYEGTINTSSAGITLAVPRDSPFTDVNEVSGVASMGDVDGVSITTFSSSDIRAVVGNPWIKLENSVTGLPAGTRAMNLKFNYIA